MITISGMIIRTSNIIPEMREGIVIFIVAARNKSNNQFHACQLYKELTISLLAFFKCHVCHATQTIEIDRGTINEPTSCQHCNTQQSMGIVHNRSQFTDKQMVKMQESPDDMPAGQTPHTVIMYAYGDLVDAVQPGDR